MFKSQTAAGLLAEDVCDHLGLFVDSLAGNLSRKYDVSGQESLVSVWNRDKVNVVFH